MKDKENIRVPIVQGLPSMTESQMQVVFNAYNHVLLRQVPQQEVVNATRILFKKSNIEEQ